MRAAWRLRPRLSVMGPDAGQRPYKSYFAHYARKAYPRPWTWAAWWVAIHRCRAAAVRH